MKRSQLITLVREVIQELDEANTTQVGGSGFTAGQGETYATPNFLGNAKRAKKTLTKLGWKKQERPKRPSHTKMFDYL
jgi:hypothetical protein